MDILKIAKSAAKVGKDYVVKNSPSILTAISGIGTVTSVIFGIKATPAAMKAISDLEEEYGRPLTWKEKVKVCWKLYIPTAGMVVVSVGSSVGANAINLNRNAKLITACGALEATLSEYQKRVVETIGEEAEKDIRKATAEKLSSDGYDKGKTQNLPFGDELFYLYDTDQWFRSDIFKVRNWGIEIREKMLKGPEMYVSAPVAFEMFDNPLVKCPPYLSDSGVDFDDDFQILEEPARTKDGQPYTILYFDPPMHESFASNNH